MKRNEIVESLIKEGFTEKTLVKFSDKQLSGLHERIISEQDTKGSVVMSKSTTNPVDVKKMTDQGLNVELREKKEKCPCGCDKDTCPCGPDCKKCDCGKKKNKKETKDWLKSLAESNFHSFTSKNEIMELVTMKLNEVEVGPNVKKGHNGIPEFMSYDAISNTEVKEAAPTTKPSPTKPKVNPGTKPRTPYSPKPGEKSKPKALGEDDSKNTPSKPNRDNPYLPDKPKTPFQPKTKKDANK